MAQAGQLLVEWELTAAIVCDEAGRVAGIVTDRDLARTIAQEEDPWTLDAGAMWTGADRDPHPLHPQDCLHEALAALVRHQLWHLPVTLWDEPVGTLHLADVIASWASQS